MSQLQQSYGRNVKIRVYATSIASNNGVPSIKYDNGYTEFGSVQVDGTPGYRIKGKVIVQNQTTTFASNPINFSIYNLGKTSRSILESKIATRVDIFAGYGTSPKNIAVANILWANTHKDRADYITDVIAGDGHFGLVNGLINKSFSGAVTNEQVVRALLNSLQGTGIIVGTVTVPSGSLNNGIVLSGSPLRILADFCQKIGAKVVFQANTVNILPLTADLGNPAILVSEDTGMIGIPEVRPPQAIGTITTAQAATMQNNLFVRMLMRPEIGLGQLLNIQSKFVNGKFVTARVTHDFDSWSGPFFTECECFLAGSNYG